MRDIAQIKVGEVTAIAENAMLDIQRFFLPGTKITLIVRPPSHSVEGDTDFVLTDDELDSAIAVLQRRKERGHEGKEYAK